MTFSRYQAFENPHCKSSEGAEHHPYISWSPDFCRVPSIVNGRDLRFIVCDLETIIALVLFPFNFSAQWSHHSLTFPRSRFRNSATATLTPGNTRTAIKVESSAWPTSLLSNVEKSSEGWRWKNNANLLPNTNKSENGWSNLSANFSVVELK